DSTTDGTVGVGQLVKQARLAHTRFAHNGYDFAATLSRPFQCCLKLLHLGIAANEATQASKGGSLKASPRLARANQLEDFDRRVQTMNRYGAERLGPYEALHQTGGPGGHR